MVRNNMIKDSSLSKDQLNKLKNFNMSDGWCTRFSKRKCLNSRVLYGEAGSADVEGSKEQIQSIRQLLSSYQADNNYIVDETALFYKLLPWPSYILAAENMEKLGGTKK